jgi:hypothetical protein
MKAKTKGYITATVDPSVLVTSKGPKAADESFAGTSVGKSQGERVGVAIVMTVVAAVLDGPMGMLMGRI